MKEASRAKKRNWTLKTGEWDAKWRQRRRADAVQTPSHLHRDRAGLPRFAQVENSPATNATMTAVKGPDGLTSDDPGIGLLAEAVANVPGESLLLLACGSWPRVPRGASCVTLDVRETLRADLRPIAFSELACVPRFAHVCVWPRAHLGHDFAEQCIALAASVLVPGGKLWLCARKARGVERLQTFAERAFGRLDVVARARGYRLVCATLMASPAPWLDDIIQRQYEIPPSTEIPFWLHTRPGMFSRKAIDGGSRVLLEAVRDASLNPQRVLDMGAGYGALTFGALAAWPRAHVVAIESSTVAAAALRRNAERLQLASRVCLCATEVTRATLAKQTFDVVLAHPPTHVDAAMLTSFLAVARNALRPNAPGYFVVNRRSALENALTRAGAQFDVIERDGYAVFCARW